MFEVLHSRTSAQSGLTSAKAPSQHPSSYTIPDLTYLKYSLRAAILAAWKATLSHMFATFCSDRSFHSEVCPIPFACQALGSVIALSRAVNKTPLTTIPFVVTYICLHLTCCQLCYNNSALSWHPRIHHV